MTTAEAMDCAPFANGSFPSSSSRPCLGSTPPKCKPMKRKSSPNRASVFKSSAIAPCSECGKQFNSWKALFGHMRCHPDRPYRGMNMKKKQKPMLMPPVRASSNWDHITDEITRAALILMEMSGQSVEHIVSYIRRNCKGKVEIGKVRVDCNPPLRDAEKEFVELKVPLPDLNLAAPVDEECIRT